MVTLADVAALAGVSEATVSRVMSSSRPVGRDVEARVRRAATELGYVGNSIARALRKNRTDTVGMVVPSILNPFFTTLVDSVERALHAEGKQLSLCDSRQNPEVEAEQLRSLVHRQVDGIIVSACDQVASVPALRAAALSVPLVQLDRRVDVEGTDWIGIDDDEAMRLVLEELASTGVRTAAFVTSALTNSSTHLRLEGFRRHAARLGITVRESWIQFGEYTIESGEAAARQLLAGADRPEAIVCADDLIAIGVLRACRQLGVRVPDEVQVTGFDDITFAAYVVPGLTTLAQPTDLMATEAFRLLGVASTSLATRRPATRMSFAPTLVVRETTRSHR
ncbi:MULTISPECIES: LacI family DNA-binding transcriptional regulator [unclassified Curtobacterium]|uniref:LacI family DNA-binding transcriptional regulator n=1 Tax=unclassified Curtobacterium TaxID=257496 RepID=UPI000DA97A85|nr:MULTISPECIES: LacI family DNA-binding transcriptional regulator [unclassified Curtobacterium]PZE26068.1 LacI family transcriptional regulator [Curtobacterium sp. MCBD17_028]PZE77728.1 LacI family transcriptional regulator [Curtobacterium sp. MCBD17_019]PZF62063.1 LacI family transcriptional regulator [Curtobacterium sp. MCBD17_034]PZM34004.1 LacI family transcriptional regulator [Curtobacterium sp. MCBD17_031]WIE54708.1 LacI family DNA-binding transcriptional regulator [Curtobacterium sp. M